MEVKPGYKQTEVGVIPEEWEVMPLIDVCELDIADGIHTNSQRRQIVRLVLHRDMATTSSNDRVAITDITTFVSKSDTALTARPEDRTMSCYRLTERSGNLAVIPSGDVASEQAPHTST